MFLPSLVVSAATLYWGKDDETFKAKYPSGFEVIMGGDLIYSRQVVDPLLKCINTLLAPGGIFFMIYVDRAGTGLGPAFLEMASKTYNMVSSVKQLEVKVDEADTYLYQLRRSS